jgi:hypothetical protein
MAGVQRSRGQQDGRGFRRQNRDTGPAEREGGSTRSPLNARYTRRPRVAKFAGPSRRGREGCGRAALFFSHIAASASVPSSPSRGAPGSGRRAKPPSRAGRGADVGGATTVTDRGLLRPARRAESVGAYITGAPPRRSSTSHCRRFLSSPHASPRLKRRAHRR